jgi:hypothetical protein
VPAGTILAVTILAVTILAVTILAITILAITILAEITALAVNHDRIVRSGASAPVVIHGYCLPKPSLPAWTRTRAAWHARDRGSSTEPPKAGTATMTVTEIGRPATDGDAAAEETRLRRELAAVYRLIAHFRMTDLIYNHISVRLPGPEHRFLLNPFGLLYEEVTASNLVIVGLDGQLVTDGAWKVNPAGFVIHSAIHEAREDALCVLHRSTGCCR